MSGDPAQTALYLKAVYARILDEYFSEASFFKPTGDGLLLIIPFRATEPELARVTRTATNDALRLHDAFASIVAEDKLIRFPHPREIGIGIAVGSVSRLAVRDITLDYTGRPLNVASRLMDLARPHGVVLEATLDFDALAPGLRKRFASDHVYLKGVADQDGVDILYTTPETGIPERYRRPLRSPLPHQQKERCTVAEAKRRQLWVIDLEHEPADRTKIEIMVAYPEYRSGKPTGTTRYMEDVDFTYGIYDLRPSVTIDYDEILAAPEIKREKLPGRETIVVIISYPIDPEEPPIG